MSITCEFPSQKIEKKSSLGSYKSCVSDESESSEHNFERAFFGSDITSHPLGTTPWGASQKSKKSFLGNNKSLRFRWFRVIWTQFRVTIFWKWYRRISIAFGNLILGSLLILIKCFLRSVILSISIMQIDKCNGGPTFYNYPKIMKVSPRNTPYWNKLHHNTNFITH